MKHKMLKTIILISTAFLVAVVLIQKNANKKPVIVNPNPRSEKSWVGDVMPFYDGNQWNIFYLEDHRDGRVGFHPFSLLTTNDFVTYTDEGEVIPFVDEELSQERALGTGSIIKDKDGLYHSFYTAHNGLLEPKEAIMHATSKDLVNWKKQSEDTFFGSQQYQRNDFRDPFVFFNEVDDEYWMLITTRKNDTGVIARYTSKDLKTWTDQGVFFENDLGTDSNLECPSLVFYNGKWYLAFSDQWPDRVTHYRVADSLDAPFEKPSNIDHWDSNAFYAGQIQQDDQGNLYVFAWIPTKEAHDDNKPYNWAGNLAIHQLTQEPNGDLSASLASSVNDYLLSKQPLIHIAYADESVLFKQNDDISILEANVEYNPDDEFGFTFNYDEDSVSQLNIVFKDGRIEYHNNGLDYVDRSKPLSSLNIIDHSGTVSLKLVVNDDIIIFYINDQQAFSTRMIRAKGKDFKFFIKEGNPKLHIKE